MKPDIPPYLADKILRHSTAITKLKKDISSAGGEFHGVDIESAIAFDAADYVWAFLSSMGCDEANETREIRNEIAFHVKSYLKSKGLKFNDGSLKAVHPKKSDSNESVEILSPTTATSAVAWGDALQIATVAPAGNVPRTLNGLPFDSWTSTPIDEQQWSLIDGKHGGLFDEPLYVPVPGKRAAAGVIIEEIDGRVWVTHPTNAHAGYEATFPKGEVGKVNSMQAAAIREAYLKTGLKVAITGYCGDYERGQTKTRYYFARRVAGNPVDMGWKAQAVSLVPLSQLSTVLRHPNDAKLIQALTKEKLPARRHILKYEFGLSSGHRMLAVLNGFHEKFRAWPCRIFIDSGMAIALETEIFTALGWEMLNDKLEVIPGQAGTLLAEGANGEQCNYERDACNLNSTMTPNADIWLWGVAVGSG